MLKKVLESKKNISSQNQTIVSTDAHKQPLNPLVII